MQRLKDYRDTAEALPDLLNYGYTIDKGVYLNKDGSVSAGFYYHAPDANSSTPVERVFISSKMNTLLARLGTGWAVHIDAIRKPIMDYPGRAECDFKDIVNNLIDEERRVFFKEDGNYYETIFTIILTYEPPSKNKSRVADLMFNDGVTKKTNLGDKMLEFFKSKIDEFQSLASNIVKIDRMMPYEYEDEFNQIHTRDEFLEFLNFSLTGKHNPINVPPYGAYLDSYIGAFQFYGGVTPKIDDKFIGVISIDGFPQESVPNMLDQLSNLEINYRWSTRFIFRDQHEALADLQKYRRKWLQKVKGWKEQIFGLPSTKIDEHAQSMVNEIDQAIAETNSTLLAYGYYTSNIILMDTDREALDHNLKEVIRIINNLGFNGRIEDINAIEAWLGSLASHTIQNVRRPLISTYNLSHMMPLSSIWAGDKYNSSDKFPPQSPALLYTMSHGSTPFRLNLHVGDIGHTLIFGPTGAGKSTLLAMLVSQFKKYPNNQIFAFDKGNSLLPLTLASKGSHYELGGDESTSVAGEILSFAPLANINTDFDQAWAETWIESMLVMQDVMVTPENRKTIHEAMTIQRTTDSSSMTDFVANIQDKTLSAALNHYTLDGPMGHLLDGEIDNLSLNNLTVFEIEELMNLGDKNLVPVLLYLFHKIEKSLDGRPTLLVLDEAWIMLGHPVFKEKIREWLKVLRKANCAVVLATQSLSDAGKSGILDVLQESCPTKILLPNPNAFNKGSGHNLGPYDYYQQFGLNDTQISIIANATPKKEYYFMSINKKNRLINLVLGDLALSFVGASGKDDLRTIKKLIKADKDNWVFNWMDKRGVNYSQYMQTIKENT
jgi:type IV secretion system protein VirB4